jgi:hypothetical protein
MDLAECKMLSGLSPKPVHLEKRKSKTSLHGNTVTDHQKVIRNQSNSTSYKFCA